MQINGSETEIKTAKKGKKAGNNEKKPTSRLNNVAIEVRASRRGCSMRGTIPSEGLPGRKSKGGLQHLDKANGGGKRLQELKTSKKMVNKEKKRGEWAGAT